MKDASKEKKKVDKYGPKVLKGGPNKETETGGM